MPYQKIKAMLKQFLKTKQETPDLPTEVIDEFIKDFEAEVAHLKIFFSVYKRHHMRPKIEKRMKLFENHHDHWKEVQKTAAAMVKLAETAKKTWSTKKKKGITGETKTNKQIYNMLFHTLSKTNKGAIHRLAEKGEIACEHGVKLQRKYLFHITDKRIKKSFEKALVDAYKIWDEFTDAIKEREYKIK
jgi:hypothetical protein